MFLRIGNNLIINLDEVVYMRKGNEKEVRIGLTTGEEIIGFSDINTVVKNMKGAYNV